MNTEKFDFEQFSKEAAAQIKGGQPILGKNGALTPLIKKFLEGVLDGELDNHLLDDDSPNRRNGKTTKVIKSSMGNFDLSTPRDRDNTFEPEIVKKRQTNLTQDIDQRIITMYAYGRSYSDISSELRDLLGLEVSEAHISAVTDRVLPMMEEWRNRPLEEIYTFLWMDAIHYKVRDEGRILSKAVYCIIGLNQEGKKDLLGLYMSENEGAKFWLQVLTNLRSRGVKDVLVACIDGLKGFAEAIEVSFPQAEVQLCIVHQIRNSIKYVATKDQKEFMVDLKKVYQALTKDEAEVNLDCLIKKWSKKYSIVTDSWKNNWERLSQYFKFSPPIRKVIYTTNTIEGFNRQLRKYTKSKSVFPNDKSVLKLLYLLQERITRKWTMPIQNWAEALSELSITFEGRLRLKM